MYVAAQHSVGAELAVLVDKGSVRCEAMHLEGLVFCSTEQRVAEAGHAAQASVKRR